MEEQPPPTEPRKGESLRAALVVLYRRILRYVLYPTAALGLIAAGFFAARPGVRAAAYRSGYAEGWRCSFYKESLDTEWENEALGRGIVYGCSGVMAETDGEQGWQIACFWLYTAEPGLPDVPVFSYLGPAIVGRWYHAGTDGKVYYVDR